MNERAEDLVWGWLRLILVPRRNGRVCFRDESMLCIRSAPMLKKTDCPKDEEDASLRDQSWEGRLTIPRAR